MRSRTKVERELSFWIDCLVEEMGDMTRSNLKEEDQIERRIMDVGFREELVEHIISIVQYKKLSEALADEGIAQRTYLLEVSISQDRMEATAPMKARRPSI